MIKLCGVHLSQLPSREALTAALEEPLYRSWKERHRQVRDETTARISLGGILLLQSSVTERDLIYSDKGRPCFKNGTADLSITHTEQDIFCATESERIPPASNEANNAHFFDVPRVGLDAENLSRVAHIRLCPLAERWFSEEENDIFQESPLDATFLRIWTRKEALVKWLGTGLSQLHSVNTVTAPEKYGVRFFEYWEGDTMVTLCCHADATPPNTVHMMFDDELF